MTLLDRINWLMSFAHQHSNSRGVLWTKTEQRVTAHLKYAPDGDGGGGGSSSHVGMFHIEDVSDYDADTFQVAIYDNWPSSVVNAGWARVNDAILEIPHNLGLTIPAQFINAEEYLDVGYIVARFSLDGSQNPQFDDFAIIDEADLETYTTEKANYLIGRVYGVETTDGSLVTTTIHVQQDHYGWITDVLLKECP